MPNIAILKNVKALCFTIMTLKIIVKEMIQPKETVDLVVTVMLQFHIKTYSTSQQLYYNNTNVAPQVKKKLT